MNDADDRLSLNDESDGDAEHWEAVDIVDRAWTGEGSEVTCSDNWCNSVPSRGSMLRRMSIASQSLSCLYVPPSGFFADEVFF